MFINVNYQSVTSRRQLHRSRVIETIGEAILCTVCFFLMALGSGHIWWAFIVTPLYLALLNWCRWKKNLDILSVGGHPTEEWLKTLPEK